MQSTVYPHNAECRHALNDMLDRKSESSRGLHFSSGGQGSDAFLVHNASAPTAGPATTLDACAGRVYVACDPYAPLSTCSKCFVGRTSVLGPLRQRKSGETVKRFWKEDPKANHHKPGRDSQLEWMLHQARELCPSQVERPH